jgi:hypothetical protein
MISKKHGPVNGLRVIEKYECNPSMEEEVVVSLMAEDIYRGKTELVLEHKKDNKNKPD